MIIRPSPPPAAWGLLLVLGLLGVSSPSRAQDPSRLRFVHWAYQDVASITTNTKPSDGLYLLGGVAVVGGFSLLDTFINHEVAEGYSGAFSTYVDLANVLGGPGAKFPVVGVFTASLLTDDVRFQDAAFTSMQALAYSAVLNQAVKFAVGRVRPEDTDGQYHIKPFSGHTSFPSGHTNAAFAILTPWALYYPHPVSYALLLIGAGGTGLARISHEKHWASDVAAGAVQGFLTAYWLTKRHKRLQAVQRAGAHVTLAPALGPEAVMLTLRARF